MVSNIVPYCMAFIHDNTFNKIVHLYLYWAMYVNNTMLLYLLGFY